MRGYRPMLWVLGVALCSMGCWCVSCEETSNAESGGALGLADPSKPRLLAFEDPVVVGVGMRRTFQMFQVKDQEPSTHSITGVTFEPSTLARASVQGEKVQIQGLKGGDGVLTVSLAGGHTERFPIWIIEVTKTEIKTCARGNVYIQGLRGDVRVVSMRDDGVFSGSFSQAPMTLEPRGAATISAGPSRWMVSHWTLDFSASAPDLVMVKPMTPKSKHLALPVHSRSVLSDLEVRVVDSMHAFAEVGQTQDLGIFVQTTQGPACAELRAQVETLTPEVCKIAPFQEEGAPGYGTSLSIDLKSHWGKDRKLVTVMYLKTGDCVVGARVNLQGLSLQSSTRGRHHRKVSASR